MASSWGAWCQMAVDAHHIKGCWIVSISGDVSNEAGMGVGCWGRCDRNASDPQKCDIQEQAALTAEEQALAKSLYKALHKPDSFYQSGLVFKGQKFKFVNGTSEEVSFFTKEKGGYIAMICPNPACVWIAQLEENSELRAGMADLGRAVGMLGNSYKQ